MNSKRKDLQYASVFLLAVVLTFLMGKGDRLWLTSWGDLIPSIFVLFIAGDCFVQLAAPHQAGRGGERRSLEHLLYFSDIQFCLHGRFVLHRAFHIR